MGISRTASENEIKKAYRKLARTSHPDLNPGEAKGELKKRLEKDNLGERIVGVETADKMTEPQIAAKVKEHFLHRSAA